jgi:hypothetical protein
VIQGVETTDLHDGDGSEDSAGETLESVLTQLGLASFLEQFRKEQIDLDALVSCLFVELTMHSVFCLFAA